VYEIDLTASGIYFMMTPRAAQYPGPYINGSPGETIRQTTRSFVNGIGAQLGINGAYYASLTQNGLNWANNLGITASNGDRYSPWEGSQEPSFRNAINISQNNEAIIVKRPNSVPTGFETVPSVTLYNAVSGSTRLVENGVNVVVPGCTYCAQNPRSAIGLTAGNAKLLLMAVDGRQTGFSEGLTGPEIADLLISYGAYNAIDLDGGGSTTIVADYYADGMAAKVLNSPSDGSERAVGSNLAVFALPNGDYNQDGEIDAADYVMWRKSIGGTVAYDAWREGFGTAGAGAGGNTVPEPATCCGSIVLVLALSNHFRLCRTHKQAVNYAQSSASF
jgi:hypothetical protein